MNATNDLKLGQITPWMFLRQLSFHENQLCDSLLLFEDLNELEEMNEMMDNQYTNQTVDEIEQQQKTVNDQDSSLCVLCYHLPRNCVLMPCHHLAICTVCYDKLKRTDNSGLDREELLGSREIDALAAEAQLVPIIDITNEEEETLRIPACPLCKRLVENVLEIFVG